MLVVSSKELVKYKKRKESKMPLLWLQCDLQMSEQRTVWVFGILGAACQAQVHRDHRINH